MSALGAVLTARDTTSGITSRYYFSRRDYELREVITDESVVSDHHLSLGASLDDWHLATAASAGEIYKDLIKDSRQLFSDEGSEPASGRKVEILAGNLALFIARRLARSTEQVRTLGDSHVVNPSTINQSLAVKLPTPLKTIDSYGILMSAELDRLIDHLTICQHFRIASTVTVRMTDDAEVSESGEIVEKRPILSRAYLLVQKLLAKKSSRNSISISATYIGRGKELMLGLLLGQAPSLLEVRPNIKPSQVSPLRDLLLVGPLSTRDIALFLMKLLVPWGLKEDYSLTSERAYSLGFARNPSVIFTSNSYSGDDEFKTHLANAISTATYIVGQHGNGAGVTVRTKIIPELNASDLYLSWGWGECVAGVYPFGQIKPAVKGRLRKKLKGVTLFLRDDFDSYLQADVCEPNSNYFKSIVNLCTALDDLEITTQLRLHSSTTEIRRQYLSEAIANMSFVSVAQNRPSISKLLASGMGIVFGYDSTGMLEMGTAGIPFFLFAPDGLRLVRQEFRPNYDYLRSAGLLSEEPYQAAQLIATWISVSREERKTQCEAIQNFTKGIAHGPKNKIRALRKILKNADGYVAHSRLERRVETTD
jgi:putative transferase (TIGR04331 family)